MRAQVEMLTYLASVAQGPCLKIEVLLHVVSAIFDLSPSMATHLPVPLWKRCVGVALDILAILGPNSHIIIDEAFDGSAGVHLLLMRFLSLNDLPLVVLHGSCPGHTRQAGPRFPHHYR